MELRHLRYFGAVAQYLSYCEASRRLNVAQPAISQTILDLEEEIGAKLFLRSNRSVQLTAAGTAFLGEAESILQRSDEAKRKAQRAVRGEVGVLRIGFIARLERLDRDWFQDILFHSARVVVWFLLELLLRDRCDLLVDKRNRIYRLHLS